MGLSRFDYYAPETIDEACKLAADLGEGAMFMAGGTDLLIKVKRKMLDPKALIDIKNIKGLDEVSFDEKKVLPLAQQ